MAYARTAGEPEEKLIGVYRSRADAIAARRRVSDKPGFRDTRKGFVVDEYELGKDHWTEGYITEWLPDSER